MSDRSYKDFIEDIIRSIDFIQSFTKTMNLNEFAEDIKTQYAVIRCFEVMGEAVKRLPDHIKDQNSDIPWKALAGMRDRLIHGYDTVDAGILWRTVTQDIPGLESKIKLINRDM